MPVSSRVHVIVDDDTTVRAQPGEAWVQLDEWSRRHQVCLTFVNVPAVDRLMVALAEIRDQLATARHGAA
jgi:hypothetical protein